eukprot:TRINITY_DN15211_c0_g1_i2.p1 TRINITY_DN15211_c0_g1~~TRINITY_DN15211_c0_g1_i2.p1  ORF type:complete len:504 (+),score=53.91 TRINITY_DN15211_c0_g1_i2:218-1729(+)
MSNGFWGRLRCGACCCQENVGETVQDAGATAATYVHDESCQDFSSQFADCKPEPCQALRLVEREEMYLDGGVRYKGQWQGNVCHGLGRLVRPDGTSYEGNFRCGRADGRGKLTASDGSIYDGDWDQDQAHGFGIYVHLDGSTYVGEWIRDLKEGSGMERCSDGSRYEGQFHGGFKHGEGMFTSSSGSVSYKGQFREDVMEGIGCYRFQDGRTYTGQWTNGRMHGTGSMVWPDGSKFEGSFRHGLRHGEGCLILKDGTSTRGQWVVGKQEHHDQTRTTSASSGLGRMDDPEAASSSTWAPGTDSCSGPSQEGSSHRHAFGASPSFSYGDHPSSSKSLCGFDEAAASGGAVVGASKSSSSTSRIPASGDFQGLKVTSEGPVTTAGVSAGDAAAGGPTDAADAAAKRGTCSDGSVTGQMAADAVGSTTAPRLVPANFYSEPAQSTTVERSGSGAAMERTASMGSKGGGKSGKSGGKVRKGERAFGGKGRQRSPAAEEGGEKLASAA